ncbi:Phage integrase family protein [Seinonella peptonophila]|uniref:Phage integrase family protein n=2 Tax=Seinonella peptonophila TaxID=112248 RepID=A0A1M4YB21_9BACL|nr:Phage integrase family protein [Seinonella peptonophila]
MRRGEIFGLRWQDVNFETQIVSIRQTLQRYKQKGYQIREVPKTTGSRRSVAIAHSVVQLLKKIKKQQAKNWSQWGSAYDDWDLVFAREDGRPMDMNNMTNEFATLIKQLDLSHFRFHDLRHSHASLLLQQGEHPKVISERPGHSFITITMNAYSHLIPNMQQKAAQKLDDFLSNHMLDTNKNPLSH